VVTGDVARELAESELAQVLPRRWRHVQAVAAQAERLSAIPGVAGQVLVAAAWLHDIGYAPDLHDTGFHPIDGGRFLRKLGADDRLVCLVAHHSCAVYEARVRGLEDVLLAEFPQEASVTYDALVFCDLTTGPAGQPVTYLERMKEIKNRGGLFTGPTADDSTGGEPVSRRPRQGRPGQVPVHKSVHIPGTKEP
jgi:hypothetical protein